MRSYRFVIPKAFVAVIAAAAILLGTSSADTQGSRLAGRKTPQEALATYAGYLGQQTGLAIAGARLRDVVEIKDRQAAVEEILNDYVKQTGSKSRPNAGKLGELRKLFDSLLDEGSMLGHTVWTFKSPKSKAGTSPPPPGDLASVTLFSRDKSSLYFVSFDSWGGHQFVEEKKKTGPAPGSRASNTINLPVHTIERYREFRYLTWSGWQTARQLTHTITYNGSLTYHSPDIIGTEADKQVELTCTFNIAVNKHTWFAQDLETFAILGSGGGWPDGWGDSTGSWNFQVRLPAGNPDIFYGQTHLGGRCATGMECNADFSISASVEGVGVGASFTPANDADEFLGYSCSSPFRELAVRHYLKFKTTDLLTNTRGAYHDGGQFDLRTNIHVNPGETTTQAARTSVYLPIYAGFKAQYGPVVEYQAYLWHTISQDLPQYIRGNALPRPTVTVTASRTSLDAGGQAAITATVANRSHYVALRDIRVELKNIAPTLRLTGPVSQTIQSIPPSGGSNVQFTLTAQEAGQITPAIDVFWGWDSPVTQSMIPAQNLAQTVNVQTITVATAAGSIAIDCSPPGAAVYLDGVAKGAVTTLPNVSPGQHQLRLTKSGYQDWTGTVTVTGGQTATVHVTLAPVQPSADTSGPVIAGLQAVNSTATTATIVWTTDDQANSKVDYRKAGGSTATTGYDRTYVTQHSVTLTGLTPGTTYYVKAFSQNSSGYGSGPSNEISFTTAVLDQTAAGAAQFRAACQQLKNGDRVSFSPPFTETPVIVASAQNGQALAVCAINNSRNGFTLTLYDMNGNPVQNPAWVQWVAVAAGNETRIQGSTAQRGNGDFVPFTGAFAQAPVVICSAQAGGRALLACALNNAPNGFTLSLYDLNGNPYSGHAWVQYLRAGADSRQGCLRRRGGGRGRHPPGGFGGADRLSTGIHQGHGHRLFRPERRRGGRGGGGEQQRRRFPGRPERPGGPAARAGLAAMAGGGAVRLATSIADGAAETISAALLPGRRGMAAGTPGVEGETKEPVPAGNFPLIG